MRQIIFALYCTVWHSRGRADVVGDLGCLKEKFLKLGARSARMETLVQGKKTSKSLNTKKSPQRAMVWVFGLYKTPSKSL